MKWPMYFWPTTFTLRQLQHVANLCWIWTWQINCAKLCVLKTVSASHKTIELFWLRESWLKQNGRVPGIDIGYRKCWYPRLFLWYGWTLFVGNTGVRSHPRYFWNRNSTACSIWIFDDQKTGRPNRCVAFSWCDRPRTWTGSFMNIENPTSNI